MAITVKGPPVAYIDAIALIVQVETRRVVRRDTPDDAQRRDPTRRSVESGVRLEMRLLAITLVACGGAATTTIANHEVPSRLSCGDPAIGQLRELFAKRWHAPHLRLRCAAGEFNASGFFLEAEGDGLHRTGIVDPSGAELVPFVDEPVPEVGVCITRYDAADLDGDGEDEIIETWRKTSAFMIHPDSWLVVRVVDHHKFRQIRGPYLSRYHPDLGGCSSTWSLRSGAIRVAVDVLPGIPPTDCLQAGLHTFALRGNVLVDASRPRH